MESNSKVTMKIDEGIEFAPSYKKTPPLNWWTRIKKVRERKTHETVAFDDVRLHRVP